MEKRFHRTGFSRLHHQLSFRTDRHPGNRSPFLFLKSESGILLPACNFPGQGNCGKIQSYKGSRSKNGSNYNQM